jgi:hypothetical protein
MRKKTIVIVAAISAAIAFVSLAAFAVLVIPADATSWGNPWGTKLAAKPATLAPIVGEFTGEYTEGSPVYRLPSVTVAVGRKTELARIEREEQLAGAHQNHARLAAAAPAQRAALRDRAERPARVIHCMAAVLPACDTAPVRLTMHGRGTRAHCWSNNRGEKR